MRFNSCLRFAACFGILAAAAPAHARLITVNVEWKLDASSAAPAANSGVVPAPPASTGVAPALGAGAKAADGVDGSASLSVTVSEDALGSATYHSAVFGDLLVTVRPHVNNNGSVFANILVRRTFQSAKTEVSTGQNFKGSERLLLGKTSFSPPFASPGQVYATASIVTDFKDPFAPNSDLGSGEAK